MSQPEDDGGRKRVLLIEDDDQMQEQLRAILGRYKDHIGLEGALDAGAALRLLESQARVDAIVLDLMMPYGSASTLLGAEDPDELETGINLLVEIRRGMVGTAKQAWVAVITARSGVAVGRRVRELLAGRGRIYYKPFDTLQLEDDLVKAIGVPSQVPAALLAQGDTQSTDGKQ